MPELADQIARLETFLRAQLPDAREVTVTDCRQLAGGYSRIMTAFTATIDGTARDLVMRADGPPGTAPIDTDRVQEWHLLAALSEIPGVPAPRALWVDADGATLGAKAIISEYLAGGPFLSRFREAGATAVAGAADEFADLAAEIHATDLASLPDTIDRPPSWDAYIDGMIERWARVERDLQESIPMLRYVGAWLATSRPAPAPLVLVHGEFQPGNCVYDANRRLVAVDWEFAHIGDPRVDLGWAKWVEAIQPPALIGHDDAAFCARYRDRTGLGEEIVNPLTVAYFSILPAIGVFEGLLRTQQAFIRGENHDLRTAFLAAANVTAFDGWFTATRQLEAAAQGVLA